MVSGQPCAGEQPIEPEDPFLLRDVTTVLIDCGLRPEECFRLRWEHVRDGAVHVPFGKTENARRTIPLTPRATALLEMRRAVAKSEWVFPAPTRSGHIEKSSLKKQHPKACKTRESDGFSAVHLPPHLPNAVGGVTWTRTPWRTWRATAIFPPPDGTSTRKRTRSGSDRTRAKCSGWAQNLGTVTKKRLKALSPNRR